MMKPFLLFFDRKLFSVFLLAFVFSFSSAVELVEVVPEQVGMSADRLGKLDATLESLIDKKKLPGTVSMIMREGKVVHFSAHGFQDLEERKPMQKDSIFRIASQTKAIVSVAVMMLQEDGALVITELVSKYLPEYASTSVAEADGNGGYTIVPAKRKITIRDLLMHTSGVSYGWGLGEDLWKKAGIQGWYFADRNEPIREYVRRMASLPFQAQPGERWVYGYNTDILGALVEVVSGKPLDQFLKERIFDPLGMSDTHFFLPQHKIRRLTTVYALRNGVLSKAPVEGTMNAQGAYVEGPRKCLSGGAGLLSTAHDYGRFLSMLLGYGELDGKRLLSRKSVELMSVNHLSPEAKSHYSLGRGFGLGFDVIDDIGLFGELGSVGGYGWGGAYHTSYWIDPAERLVALYFTQVRPTDDGFDHQAFRSLVYQSIID